MLSILDRIVTLNECLAASIFPQAPSQLRNHLRVCEAILEM